MTIGSADGSRGGTTPPSSASSARSAERSPNASGSTRLPENAPDQLSAVPSDGVDGYYLAVDPYSAGVFLEQQSELSAGLADRVDRRWQLALLDRSAAAAAWRPSRRRRYRRGSSLCVPTCRILGVRGGVREHLSRARRTRRIRSSLLRPRIPNAMEAVLRTLEAVDGDLSDGQRRFRAALAEIELDAPNGPIRLDVNRQAIAPTYLRSGDCERRRCAELPAATSDRGSRRRLQRAPRPGGPAPSRSTPSCEAGNPPPWASTTGSAYVAARIDQVKRVRLARGASPPGRRPRRTSSTGHFASCASRSRVAPRPSRCHLVERPTTSRPASRSPPGSPARRAARAAARRRSRGLAARPARHARAAGSSRACQHQGLRLCRGAAVSYRRAERSMLRARRRPNRARTRRRERPPSPPRPRRRRASSATSQGLPASTAVRSGSGMPVLERGRRFEEHEIHVLLGGEPDESSPRRVAQ